MRFNKEEKKKTSKFDKPIFNNWDIFINWSLSLGNSHFAITINFPEYYDDSLSLSLLNLKENDKEDEEKYNLVLKEYLLYLLDYPKLTTWFFIINEEHKNKTLHVHGILAIRNLTDFNKNIKINILDQIKEKPLIENQHSYGKVDIVIKNLTDFLNIKKWIMYLHKSNWLFKPKLYIINKYYDYSITLFHTAYFYDVFYNKDNKYILECDSIEIEKIEQIICNIKNYNYNDYINNPTIKLNYNLIGCKINNNKLLQETFIDLISYYLYLNNIYIYKNNIYKKINDSLISYELIGKIKEELYNNFEDKIILFFLNNYPCHFKSFDFYFLIKNFKQKFEFILEKIEDIITNKINPDFSLMEFIDGIYDLSNNKFIKKNNFKELSNYNGLEIEKVTTIKYYNQYYNWVRQNEPKNWINGIKNALNIEKNINITKLIKNSNIDNFENNINNFIIICLFVGTLFQKNNKNKKRFLYLYGKSNTGKTTYINKVLSHFFLNENIGTIVSDNNFTFQDIENKLLVIIDEFKYNSKLNSEFLKLLGGEKLLVSKKYSKKHINITNSRGVVASNSLFLETDKFINEALYNRLYVIEFINKIIKNNIDIDEKLKKEEPNIYIYCNKIFYYFLFKFKKIENKKINNILLCNKQDIIKTFF